jgi:hypothetical protein
VRVASLALELHEEVLVADVRRDGHHLGVAQANQLGVDHRVADPDVRQEPAIAISSLDIELEPNATAADETSIHLGRLASSGLLTLARMVNLGGVDADVADLLHAVGELHVDRVAVDDADHRALDRAGRHGAASEKRQKQQREMPPPERHAATVSPGVGECQDLETVVAGSVRPA